jgi:hypothetical protein
MLTTQLYSLADMFFKQFMVKLFVVNLKLLFCIQCHWKWGIFQGCISHDFGTHVYTVGVKILHILSPTQLNLSTLSWKRNRFLFGRPLLGTASVV